ncbi:MAG: ribosomal-processing cysteine protease Prp [Clostridia bacterium]|nr:ribosomal-processing cysteine protease Prp [Clostridia bacterium]
MTKIIIFKQEKLISGFQIKGHSRFAEAGADIVCSGISTASQMTLVGLSEVLNLQVESEIRDGYMFVHLGEADLKNPSAQAILEAMEKTLQEIANEYARFVKMEVKKDVY